MLAFGSVSALVLIAAAGGWLLAGYVSDSIGRVNAGTSGAPPGSALNILVAGVDVRTGLTRHQQVELHVGHVISHNSDTLMLVHITADHQHAEVVSLPRDTWVHIPGFGMNKINAAYGLGGPKLAVRTVEEVTGLTINDYVQVNFLGFVKIINALGGVNICLPFAVDDPYSGLHLSAGRHHVYGVTALQFARDRHSFALSDLARISDQQQMISSVLTEATSSGLLTSPVRFASVLSAVTSALKVDGNFDLTGLAYSLRDLRPSNVVFIKIPLASVNYTTPTGESAVLWDTAAARRLFAAIGSDQFAPSGHHRRHRHRTAPPTGAGSKTASQAACRK